MQIYKANKYYTSMNDNTFLILGIDNNILAKANELFIELVTTCDNDEENYYRLDKFIEDNSLIYLDDVNEIMETCKIQGTNLYCSASDGIGYVYEIVRDFSSRF